MASTAEIEDACFDAFKALYAADTASGGLNKSTQSVGAYTSPAYLIGGYVRYGDPSRTREVPRVEHETAFHENIDTPEHSRARLTLRLHVITNRQSPDGFGTDTSTPFAQRAIALRVRQIFGRSAPATSGGWYFSTVKRMRGFQAPPSDTEQHYIAEFAVLMSTGAGQGF